MKLWTDGRTADHGHPISSPCEPNGSGELKIKKKSLELVDLFQASGTLAHHSLYKSWPWNDLDLFYDKVKFGHIDFLKTCFLFFQKVL